MFFQLWSNMQCGARTTAVMTHNFTTSCGRGTQVELCVRILSVISLLIARAVSTFSPCETCVTSAALTSLRYVQRGYSTQNDFVSVVKVKYLFILLWLWFLTSRADRRSQNTTAPRSVCPVHYFFPRTKQSVVCVWP